MARQSLKNVFRLIEAATTQMPVNQQFVADLKASIEKQDSLEVRKPSKSYKPSSMACIRNMYFQVTGTEVDDERSNACLVGICESGSARHEHIQSAITKMKDFGMDCEYIDVAKFVKMRGLDYLEIVKKQGFETKLYHKDLNMSFLCDGIIKYKGQYYILEIKTESVYKWQSREGIAEEHIPQGIAYATCFGINQVMFLYENRDNCDKKAFVLEVTDDMKYDYIISKIEECDRYVKRLIPPPKPENVSKKTCQYCNYKTSCRKAGK